MTGGRGAWYMGTRDAAAIQGCRGKVRMKILHTSDWHLGHSLYGRRRHEEFRRFLSWLRELMDREGIEALVVAGDVFDSAAPGTQTQALYYDFLREVTSEGSSCRHVVIVAGNHDSPAFLDAPAGLLSSMHVHVTGRARAPEEEVLNLCGADGETELIVCAVPFLRDRDLYRAKDGDGMDERDRLMAEGMKEHYRLAAEAAERLRAGRKVPILATGHLFAAGGSTSGDDGVRDLCVGSLGQVEADVFPENFDYVALGHLHAAQKVHGEERLRYTGSPLAMGFDEAKRGHEVRILSTDGAGITSIGVEVPVFQRMEKVEGDMEAIERRLEELSATGESVWAEVLHTGEESVPELRRRVEERVSGKLEVLRIRNAHFLAEGMDADPAQEDLEDLGVDEVFERRLREAYPGREAQDRELEELREAFRETVAAVRDGEEESCAS